MPAKSAHRATRPLNRPFADYAQCGKITERDYLRNTEAAVFLQPFAFNFYYEKRDDDSQSSTRATGAGKGVYARVFWETFTKTYA